MSSLFDPLKIADLIGPAAKPSAHVNLKLAWYAGYLVREQAGQELQS
jgi:hypothetical protein